MIPGAQNRVNVESRACFCSDTSPLAFVILAAAANRGTLGSFPTEKRRVVTSGINP